LKRSAEKYYSLLCTFDANHTIFPCDRRAG
jgi:hypothetical protein